MGEIKYYKGKEGSQSREGRKSTTGRKENDHGINKKLQSEGTKSIERRKETNKGKEGRLPKVGRKMTIGRKEDYQR